MIGAFNLVNALFNVVFPRCAPDVDRANTSWSKASITKSGERVLPYHKKLKGVRFNEDKTIVIESPKGNVD